MTVHAPSANHFVIRALTYLMFMMFAMTTDSVGVIIPEVIRTLHLSDTAAGAFHYASMSAIAVVAIFLGFLADLLGRKWTIILGLVLFALNSYLFAVTNSFAVFVTLLGGLRRSDRHLQNRRPGSHRRHFGIRRRNTPRR